MERDAAYDIAAGLRELEADDDDVEEEAQTALQAALAGITSADAARAALDGPDGPGLAAVMARLSESMRVPEALLPGLLKLPSTADRRGCAAACGTAQLAWLTRPVVSRSYEAVQEAATGLLSWRDSLQRCVAYAHMCALLWL